MNPFFPFHILDITGFYNTAIKTITGAIENV